VHSHHFAVRSCPQDIGLNNSGSAAASALHVQAYSTKIPRSMWLPAGYPGAGHVLQGLPAAIGGGPHR
jgi:hypothetical protein